MKSNAVTILGSTGTIGINTLEVVASNREYCVFALSAFKNVDKMFEQCCQFEPRYAVMVDEKAAETLHRRLQKVESKTRVLAGASSLAEIAEHPDADVVMAAIVGAAGLIPTLAAVKAAKKVLLANKEALVMAGEIFMQAVTDSGACLLPIDSEHNAIFQCMPFSQSSTANNHAGIRRVVLTASGGPFLKTPLDQFADITPAQACKHPNWEMGRKISVDSATMMNKGLEFIEACFLFDLSPSKIDVLIHPQSIVHSMVEYVDGSVLAQMGSPDMRIPIAYGLAWPQRIESGANFLDLTKSDSLQFSKPDLERFPCLRLGMEAARTGGTAATILNAANEVAVDAFLNNRLGYSNIVKVIDQVMQKLPVEAATSLENVQIADKSARILGDAIINRLN